HEATFHARSYGFRTGRSAHDAQKKLFHNLRSQSNGIEKRVIELDIEKCFDRISTREHHGTTHRPIRYQDRNIPVSESRS
ncbi:reverse transcriptase domain-containing protein, partial [Microcoleus anatoxicus]